MTRIALGIQYEGTRFSGWQRQPQVITIQNVVEEAVSTVANESIEVTASGRTDAGVHALNQIVHFDTSAVRSMCSWVLGINYYLPSDVAVHFATEVPDDFHARFAAEKRAYRYVIYNDSARLAIGRRYAAHVCLPLNETLMMEAAQCLIGEQDFSAFRSVQCQARTPNRCVHSIEIQRQGKFIVMDIAANAFLHHMVRNIAGSLILIGLGKQEVHWLKNVLESRDRTKAGPTADAAGLCLMRVWYPAKFDLPRVSPHPNPLPQAGEGVQ